MERESLRTMRLRAINVFDSLDDASLGIVLRDCTFKRVEPGEAIIVQDDTADAVYFLCEGTALTTLLSGDGREVAYERIPAGEVIGEIAALDGGPRSSYVVADTHCVIAIMSSMDFRKLVTSNADVCLAVFQRLCRTSRYLMNRLYNNQLVSMKDRIVLELVREARKVSPEGGYVVVESPPTHADLARRAGTHREAVTKHIAWLRKQGLLKGTRREMIVPDVAELEACIESSVTRSS